MAQYGDHFAVKNMESEAIRQLTGYEGDVDKLMDDVKADLGITRSKLLFEEGEFKESAPVVTSEKVETIEDPHKELSV